MTIDPDATRRRAAAFFGLLLVVIVWVYWPVGEHMVLRWAGDPQYTHGYIVPALILLVLWFRRDAFPRDKIRTSWLGAPLLVLAALLRLAGAMFAFEWLEAGSVLLALSGAVLLTAGPAVLRWAWPAAALL